MSRFWNTFKRFNSQRALYTFGGSSIIAGVTLLKTFNNDEDKQQMDAKRMKHATKTKNLQTDLLDIDANKRLAISNLEINGNNKKKSFRDHLEIAKLNPGVFKIGLKVLPNTQEYKQHYYDRVINAELHPLIERFMNLDLDRIVERYCRFNPSVNSKALKKLLEYKPKHFAWAGSDLFVTTTPKGIRQLCVIETNSCPSGQKSMPDKTYNMENLVGYTRLMGNTFKPRFEEHLKNNPELSEDKYKFAVIYDKNSIEAFGYAHGMFLFA